MLDRTKFRVRKYILSLLYRSYTALMSNAYRGYKLIKRSMTSSPETNSNYF